MHTNLSDILLRLGAQQQIAADCQALVERELATKSGVSAAAVKVAYKAVTAFAPGYYAATVESMVPDMLKQLDPFWADYRAAGGGRFGDYLVTRPDEVSEALLQVTDGMAQYSERPAVVKAYGAVRGGAARHIAAALPAVGALAERYAG
ncbi:DUF6918 family protein [Paractinoplanes rishiriensis]|uniref:Uncharacterized protein n=1 Tax=Paractinoplanes rishiriensis TaxID=1050105 RepID=A0A919MW03_9ACTN|nr:hypothetical protein [Actinoplanes rishiriensis]GIE94160.1 hypothetical protein Ari01nite_16250 [Actinoplanes rishiriensis]